MFKEHEKFWAFGLLGLGVIGLALLAFAFPINNEGSQRVVDAAMGALTLALGSAVNALFRIREPGETKVTIDQPPNQPVPVDPQ